MANELLPVLPFLLLLGSIAILPLVCKHWWEQYYPYLVLGLGALIAVYYLVVLKRPEPLVHSAQEYVSFITIMVGLFVVSGGIHIHIKGEGVPLTNTAFLAIGAILASFIGTTGASMLLIRPWIRMNRHRMRAFHVAFFIFAVSNIGGGLTPIGDPPLFLGYLRGVPFFWVLKNVFSMWLIVIAWILTVFFLIDRKHFSNETKSIATAKSKSWRFEGLHNIFFFLIIIGSVFINKPLFLREIIMMGAALGSYLTTSQTIRRKNEFNFVPINEVAILFAGIFCTMIPALEWLEHNAVKIGLQTPMQFYWASGLLSSLLDNAPTYLNFLSAGVGLFASHLSDAQGQVSYLLTHHPAHIQAISVASVCFGALTYIGNGPNFLVKSIAEQSKIDTPSFFGYVLKYSIPVLLPILALVGFLFFNRLG